MTETGSTAKLDSSEQPRKIQPITSSSSFKFIPPPNPKAPPPPLTHLLRLLPTAFFPSKYFFHQNQPPLPSCLVSQSVNPIDCTASTIVYSSIIPTTITQWLKQWSLCASWQQQPLPFFLSPPSFQMSLSTNRPKRLASVLFGQCNRDGQDVLCNSPLTGLSSSSWSSLPSPSTPWPSVNQWYVLRSNFEQPFMLTIL